MILIHILSNEEKQAIEIADYLIERKLILNAMIMEKVSLRSQDENGEINATRQVLLMGKTKALLFTTIDEELRKKYSHKMPVLYSVPIVHMDWEQVDELMDKTAKV